MTGEQQSEADTSCIRLPPGAFVLSTSFSPGAPGHARARRSGEAERRRIIAVLIMGPFLSDGLAFPRTRY